MSPTDDTLWYRRPATDWMTEALPLGNGRLGGMIFGGLSAERIQFNESSLWTGDEEDTGWYQNFGDLFVDLGHAQASEYRRALDLADATHHVQYLWNGITYRREAFCSHPDEVLAVRLTADRPGACTGALRLQGAHGEATRALDDGTLQIAGALVNDLRYEAQARVCVEGGTLAAEGAVLRFAGADAVIILLAAGTNYLADAGRGWRGEHPHARVSEQIAAASAQTWDALRQQHQADYGALFQQVTLRLGDGHPDTQRDTQERLRAFAVTPDPSLVALFFQYGRYLLIGSSRTALPANLQGLWNHSNEPPWRCDYHTDINVQMNYWPACVAGLPQCFAPLFDWVDAARSVRTRQTRAEFGARGWTARAENGIFGGSSWKWIPPSNAWLCQNLWEFYAFTRDRAYLEKLYPILKEVCEFWEDRLKALDDGTLVAPDEYSPEHGPDEEDGVSFAQQLVWDVFTNTLEAAAALEVDPEYQATLAGLRARLLGPQIGRWGQLQEWMVDRDDPDDRHRHLSHLIALYPGRQISPRTTPQWAQAAKVSMRARGDQSTGWAMAWRINLWARLLDGDHALRLLHTQLRLVEEEEIDYMAGGGTYPNMLDAHPPFQIDGNFGATAGIAEMLLQSHAEEIVLLPALPALWPAGEVRGLRARGGFVVDMDWQGGQLTRAVLYSEAGGPCQVASAGPFRVEQQQAQPEGGFFHLSLATEPGASYEVVVSS